MSSTVCGHYTLKTRVGGGSFGEVFLAEDTETGETVGLKIEIRKTRNPQIEFESTVLQLLQDGTNFPRYYAFESDDKFLYMSMEILGKSLDDLFYICDYKFTVKTVLMIADQMLNAMEFLHNMQYLYRDVKPNNFLIGKGKCSNQVFMIDFGLAKKYIDDNGDHIKFAEDQTIAGTARYASPGSLLGNQQSRRDDMIALGYLWVFFLKGTLPWIDLESEDSEVKYDKIQSMKAKMAPEELCANLPPEFAKYMKMVTSLEFDEQPHYAEYRLMFRKLFIRCGFKFDYVYDWTGNPRVEPPPPPLPRQKSSVRKPPVSARLLPPTPRERRQQCESVNGQGSSNTSYGMICDERGSLVNTCKIRSLSSRQSRMSFSGNESDSPFKVPPPPLPRKGERAPRQRHGSMCVKNPPVLDSVEGVKDDLANPVKPPVQRPKNLPSIPIIPNIPGLPHFYLNDGKAKTSRRSNSMRCESLTRTPQKSALPAINDVKRTPDPLAKQLFNDIVRPKR